MPGGPRPAPCLRRLAHPGADGTGELAVTAPDANTVVLYLCDGSADLTDLLPVFDSLGVRVSEEQAFRIDRPDGVTCWAYEFAVALPNDSHGGDADGAAADSDRRTGRLIDAFGAIWRGNAELDAFNGLVLSAGLTWRRWRCCAPTTATCVSAGSPTVPPTSPTSSPGMPG